MQVLLCALGFFLVLEGLFPMLSPDLWKKYLMEIQAISSEKIRLMGLVSVLLGIMLVWFCTEI